MTTTGENAIVSQAEKAYHQIHEWIVDCEYPPGQPLPESELSRALGMSRTPIREALNRLSADGLVDLAPGRSAVVSTVSIQHVIQLFQMRAVLETYAVRRCAARPNLAAFNAFRDEMLAQRDRLAADPHPADGFDAYYDLSNRFDHAICTGARNRFLTSSMEEIWGHSRRLRRMAQQDVERLVLANEEHLAICEAICDADAERAAKASAHHIQRSLDNAIGNLTDDMVNISIDTSF
jgi:DNA-binding GntR family transcriptional regulator